MDHINDNTFQVSVKGLNFDSEGRLMMIQEDTKLWDVPGGRIQKGEEFLDCLKRECLEETGLECEIVSEQPVAVYPAIDSEGRARIMVFFKIKINGTNFTPSNECVDLKFFTKEELRDVPSYPQLKKLFEPEFLNLI